MSAKHKEGFYSLILDNDRDVPPGVVIGFGDGSAAQSDRCGEYGFAFDNCRTKEGNPSVRRR